MMNVTKKHEAPQFEVIVNKESNMKFFASSTPPDQSAKPVEVRSWNVHEW